MQVRVLWIGKTRLPGVAELTEEYSRRLVRFCRFQAEEIRAGGKGDKGRTAEEEMMLARSADSRRVVLDPQGQRWDSPDFARFLETMQNDGQRAVSFCVGGADGFSGGFRESADLLLSLSPLTLPHELARVVLLEQLYRAFALLAHHPYPR
ncbi:MAG TPA: 23S rRNA (pseudouridine(1915)-N(3))-methyltransferase RlmH [Candidatus Glassbacteria bacterium]|nr:23S rRNA (pseudouridine(1915)-N(3))-methyltransferase RlmH [Candidatus Glassbacteria bacterium]